MKRLQTIVLFVLLFLLSCKKKDNDTPKADTHFYIKNNIGQTAHVAIYTSQSDYNRSVNALVSIDLAAGTVYDWKNADTILDYFYDWYTDNYAYNNWGIPRAYLYDTVLNSILPLYMLNLTKAGLKSQTMRGDTLSIEQSYTTDTLGVFTDNGRRTGLINGNDSESVWESYDLTAYGAQGSIWNTSPETLRRLRLVFRKDMRFNAWFYATGGTSFTESEPGSYFCGKDTKKNFVNFVFDHSQYLHFNNEEHIFYVTSGTEAIYWVHGYTYSMKKQ